MNSQNGISPYVGKLHYGGTLNRALEYTGDMIISILETYLIEVADNGQGHTRSGGENEKCRGMQRAA